MLRRVNETGMKHQSNSRQKLKFENGLNTQLPTLRQGELNETEYATREGRKGGRRSEGGQEGRIRGWKDERMEGTEDGRMRGRKG